MRHNSYGRRNFKSNDRVKEIDDLLYFWAKSALERVHGATVPRGLAMSDSAEIIDPMPSEPA